MYKLVVIGGKLRGRELILEDGENVLGRDNECELHFPVEGVSKRHCSITVTDDVAYVKDLGSVNGTFVNGSMIKSATIKNGDKISLPDTIIQVVHVKEKKVIIRKVTTDQDDDYIEEQEAIPDSLPRKIIYYFKYKVMPPFYGINKEYEWKILLGIVLTLCVFTTITFTIFPVLQDSKRILIAETALRGGHYADEIARINASALGKRQLGQLDTKFLEGEPGVQSYELFDLKGRIYRPIGKLNEFIDDAFSVEAQNWTKKESDKYVLKKLLDKGEIGIAKKIKTYNFKTGKNETIAVIAIRFAPKSLAIEASKSSKAYFESLTTSMLVALFFYGIIYFLTLKPIAEVKFQIEEAMRGKRRNIESEFLMEEMNPLREVINSMLQRIRELQPDGNENDIDDLEEDTAYVEKLCEFSEGAGIAVIVLNSEKNIKKINVDAEDLTGIRESSAIDMSLLDTAREKGFAAMVIELCDDCANNSGLGQSGNYELQGFDYTIYVNTLMGKDNFAKAFYITFIKDD